MLSMGATDAFVQARPFVKRAPCHVDMSAIRCRFVIFADP